jgi:glycosyltransferase involved in cell wall biosynthesis
MADFVSIIIPTFNRAHFVGEAIASAQRQEVCGAEILVIDDGSTDGTRELVSGLRGVQYFWQPNAGVSAARNYGLRRARGQIIAFLDSDDLWDADYLRTAVDALKATAACFFFANCRGIDADGAVDYPDYFARRGFLREYARGHGAGWRRLNRLEARRLFMRHSAAPPSGTVFRRDVLSEGWDERATIGEDRLLLIDVIFRHDRPACFSTRPLWSHRQHDSNACAGQTDKAKIAKGDIYVKQEMLNKYRSQMTHLESALVQQSIATDYLDWGYYEASRGNRTVALSRYWRSWRMSRRPTPLLAIAKLCLAGRSSISC